MAKSSAINRDMFFDWISIVYIAILILGIIIGIQKGFFRSIPTLAVIIVAAVVAFFLAQPVGNAILDSSIGESISSGIETWLQKNLDPLIYVLPVDASSLKSEVGQQAMAEIYAQLNIPGFIHSPLTNLVGAAIEDGEVMAVGKAIEEGMSLAIAMLVAFSIIFVAVIAVFLIFKLILWIIRHGARKKPSMLSRLGGALVKFAEGFLVIYIISFAIAIVASTDSEAATYFIETLRLNDPEAWSLAKWLVNGNQLFYWLSSFVGS